MLSYVNSIQSYMHIFRENVEFPRVLAKINVLANNSEFTVSY